MFGMNYDVLMGFVRHLLTAIGGVLVAMGLMDETVVTEVVGAIMTVVGFASSWWVKRDQTKS